ncbi:hypothetical protein MTO96_052100 [Rhipicephalus appendiculatus]
MKARVENGVVYSPFPSVEIPPCSVYEVIKDALAKYSDQIVVVDENAQLTGGQLLTWMKRFAAGFQKYGVTTGDRICVHMSNSVEGFAAMYGCVFAGATLVMAKPSLTERELQYLISDSDCTHVLIDSKFAAKTKSAISPLLLKGRPAAAPIHLVRDAWLSGTKLPSGCLLEREPPLANYLNGLSAYVDEP